MTQEIIKAYEKIRKALTEAPLLLMKDWNIPFKLYIYECGDGLGEALHQVQIIDEKPTEGPVCYISRQIKQTESIYGSTKGSAYTPNRHMLRWQIAIQEYRGNMRIAHKEGDINKNADGLTRWAFDNTTDNPAYVPLEAEPQIPIESIKITNIESKFF
ncbi:hypothetical protein O181_032082 [Austropuccinia psidii MF-1]|uniref:Reverse transcriptase/retrotransposon-derived protein RNase H-like domain-containing protein n=1 Tax=Austropuccinia psidii MF-1 TaxID=1389203 RepID=A0A9Q3CYT5_9BASI|nr:hypothetical protein [Austropuccinia psidii MF-1]